MLWLLPQHFFAEDQKSALFMLLNGVLLDIGFSLNF